MLQTYDERNRDLIVNVGGQLTHRDQARVSPFDSAVQGGDAVWEGLRLYGGRIFRLDEHLARLRDSAKALAFDQIPSAGEITEQIRRTIAANGMRDGVHIRLTLTRGVKVTSGMDPRLNQAGPTLIVLAEYKDPVYDAAGITLITASVRRPAPDCLDPKIHHNNLLPSILAKIEANVAGADDAVMLDHRGFIAETNATHIFMVTAGVLATPTTVSCPEGHHPRSRAGAGRVGRPRLPDRRLHAAPALHRRRGVRDRHHGRPGPGAVRGRPRHRRRPARSSDRPADRPVRRPHRRRRHPRHISPRSHSQSPWHHSEGRTGTNESGAVLVLAGREPQPLVRLKRSAAVVDRALAYREKISLGVKPAMVGLRDIPAVRRGRRLGRARDTQVVRCIAIDYTFRAREIR